MNILIVYAHPEPKSFNGAMKDLAVQTLTGAGHTVQVSDLYAQQFQPRITWDDFPKPLNPNVMSILPEMENARNTNTVEASVRAEQEKLLWSNLVILQFPLWWFSMPAIMKGWVDRVMTLGFAFHWGQMYDTGMLAGRRAIISTTTGGPSTGYEPNGRGGDISQILWPIHNGILRFCGFDVLPPFIAYGVIMPPDDARAQYLEEYKKRLLDIENAKPLFFHGSGDFDESARLKPGVIARTPCQRNDS
jgi:NAD(P)H dehydrogenase (quinone)